MRRILIMIAMTLLLGATVFAVLYRKPAKDVPLSEVEKALEAELAEDSLKKFGDMKLRRNTGLFSEDYEEILYYGKDDSMTVECFLLVKSNDEDGAKKAEEALRNYVADRIAAFSGYGPTQVALLEKSVVYANGRYTALSVSENAGEIVRKMKSIIEE